jgi:FtsP/CotA-like multicopper oxidase with cupredoxin domain
MNFIIRGLIAAVSAVLLVPLSASAQDSNIFVQCPETTDLHPTGDGILCEHVVAGDGMVTMADDAEKQQYIFSYARLPPKPASIEVNTSEYAGWVMDNGVMAAEAPAPTIVVDEDDEVFLTLTNVGMAIRPDLFDPHTIHWHGFPQASSIFDGVPDSSVSINMAASLTYYYLAKDAGTYMWHCHVEATEHMQMGMLGNLYVRPRQNKLPAQDLNGFAHEPWNGETGVLKTGNTYAYNDGDGSTRYDVEFPIQIGSFDPDFHDASFEVQPLPFAAMKDRYFMVNGRGYPDTIDPNPLPATVNLINSKVSQKVSSLITVTSPDTRVLLRISNLAITEFYTLGTSGIPMEVVGRDARQLRDGDGNNMYYKTNSLILGGGQSADVILDTTGVPAGTYFLYAKNLDKLANDAENFGGMMTEIVIN